MSLQKWNVWLDGQLIDTVFFDSRLPAAAVKADLIEHEAIGEARSARWRSWNRYDPEITIRKVGGGHRTATKRKRSYASRSKSGRGKKRRTLTRLRHAGAARKRGYGVMRGGKPVAHSRKEWIVRFGKNGVNRFYTEHHAEQFARALALNGTPYTIEVV